MVAMQRRSGDTRNGKRHRLTPLDTGRHFQTLHSNSNSNQNSESESVKKRFFGKTSRVSSGKKPIQSDLEHDLRKERGEGMKASGPEFIFEAQLKADNLPAFEREYRFDSERRYCFDFAWPSLLLAVELEGAIWQAGAHSRPLGIIRDMAKGNLAVLLGWSVLRYTPAQVKKGEALAEVKHWMLDRTIVIKTGVK